jgi:hypothetical protein
MRTSPTSPAPHPRPLGHALKESGKALGCVALLGVLVGIPAFWFIVVSVNLAEAQAHRARLGLDTLEEALRSHHARTGQLPEAAVGLRALVDAGLLRELPRDSWGNPYTYSVRGDEVEVRTLGADGAPGGRDEDTDHMIRFRLTPP